MPKDELSLTSRNFFERARVKLIMSLLIASGGLMLLGFCSFSGGQASKFNSEVSSLLVSKHLILSFEVNINPIFPPFFRFMEL
jgi:hypothetical protein